MFSDPQLNLSISLVNHVFCIIERIVRKVISVWKEKDLKIKQYLGVYYAGRPSRPGIPAFENRRPTRLRNNLKQHCLRGAYILFWLGHHVRLQALSLA